MNVNNCPLEIKYFFLLCKISKFLLPRLLFEALNDINDNNSDDFAKVIVVSFTQKVIP